MNGIKNFDGIIFDIDGTLTSTNELIFASFNHIAEKYLGKRMKKEEIISLFGPTEDQILDNWFASNSDTIKEDYYSFYSKNHHMADIYPGIKELLDYIKSKQILLSIFTGKGREAATITLKILEIYIYFDLIVTGDDVMEHKPSPEGIIKFIAHYNLKRERVLMVGDSPSDILAAHEAGVKIASVVWDSYAKDEVLRLNSDYVFETVEELTAFIKCNV
jgi:pyrophosphatase PpaX